jgi:predicted O-methyltransferase YrrM
MIHWLPKLRAAIRRSGAPCVVSFIRPTNVKVLLACLGLRGQRIVISERNDPRRQPLGRHWELLSRLLYDTADLVTFNSHGTRQALAPYVEDSKLVFLPNVLTVPEARNVEAIGGPTILAVGRLVHQKGYDVVIKAFAESADALADWRIVFLGEGPEKATLQKLALSLGVAERIEWRGHIPDPFAFYRTASIFVLTSRYEGMPNALLEAMACGLPSIVSDSSPGPLEVIDHEVNGIVVATDSVPETAAALRRLGGDAAERARLGAAARSRAEGFAPALALEAWKSALGLHGPAGRRDFDTETHNVPVSQISIIRSNSSAYMRARQIGHYVTRPKVWPDLARWLAKRIKDRVVGNEEAVTRARRAMAEGTAWCEERAQSSAEALAALGLETTLVDLAQRFPEEFAAAAARVDNVPFKLGGASNLNLVYALCEGLQATRVVETGVAYGWSSLAILLSISTRPGAALHSVDLPYLKYQNAPWVGIAVPDDRKPCWTLHRMADRAGLPMAVKALGTIDFAHYDSDKSVAGRGFADPLLWQALRPGGLLFSDDINDNFGFRDFCDSIGQQPVIIRHDNKFQGILRKPVKPSVAP